MAAPLYDVLLVLHVASAFIGFGSVAVGGYAASVGRKAADPFGEERVSSFFRPGTDWPARLVFLVPVIGLLLLLGGDHPEIATPWPWTGLFLWFVALSILSGRGWPAEARAQRALSAARAGDTSRLEEFRSSCKQMEQSSVAVTICFVLAVAIMVWQPA